MTSFAGEMMLKTQKKTFAISISSLGLRGRVFFANFCHLSALSGFLRASVIWLVQRPKNWEEGNCLRKGLISSDISYAPSSSKKPFSLDFDCSIPPPPFFLGFGPKRATFF